MNSSQVSSEGYNLKVLKHFRFKKFLRQGIKYFIILFVLFIAAMAAASYLARLPRERYSRKFSFFERAKLGAEKAFNAAFLTISAEQEDGARSQLAIAELYMRGKRLDRLNEDLPASGREDQKAEFFYAGESMKVKARYRGDSMNHWAYPQKSWRIEFQKRDAIDGIRELNLNVPRSDNQISNWLGYELARKIGGMLVPDSEMVHFRLNRNFDGVRLLLEQPNQSFLLRRNLPPGKIFVGDISSEQIYGSMPRARIYSKASAWSVKTPIEEDIGTAELASLLRVIGQTDPYRLYYKLSRMTDVDAFARYMALLEYVGSIHVDETHNGKLYFNPDTGAFSPIVWDTVSYFWGDKFPLNLGTNALFRSLLSVPEFRAKKDRVLTEMLNGSLSTQSVQRLIDVEVDKLRKDVYSFPLKIHANDKGVTNVSNAQWEESIKRLKQNVENRNKRIKKHIGDKSATFDYQIGEDGKTIELLVANTGAHPLLLSAIELNFSDNVPAEVYLKRQGLNDLLKPIKPEVKNMKFAISAEQKSIKLDDELYSNISFAKGIRGKIEPGVYRYTLSSDSAAAFSSASLNLKVTSSGSKVKVDRDASLQKIKHTSSGWWNPEAFVEVSEKVLSGNVHLSESMYLDDYTRLVIKPGTKIKLDPEVSILGRQAGIVARGTAEKPIQIGVDKLGLPWGVLAVQGGEIVLDHVNISGGSERNVQHVWYPAPLSIHRSKFAISNVKLKDSDIYFSDSNGSLENVQYKGVHTKAFNAVRSQVRATKVEKVGYEPQHRVANFKGVEAFGTPARSEREFKHSLVGEVLNTMSLEQVSAEMHKALFEAAKRDDLWKAPEYAGNSYYHDVESKDFLFRDIYFDTDDYLNYKHEISYRYRNRYKGEKEYETHIKRPFWPEFWPHRLEFQAKVNRIELPGGFSTVDESRFEFRSASKPFSDKNLPPPSPWVEEYYVPYFSEGIYRGMPTTAGKAIIDFLDLKGESREAYKFEPKVVLVTTRLRQHLNIKSPWGSGPNPDQSYIISLDRSTVYDAKPYLDFLRRKRLGYKKLSEPQVKGVLVEVELEFERNVSDVLDKRIDKLKAEGEDDEVHRLEAARNAFLQDQETIMKVLQDKYADVGISVVPASKSKYVQAVDLTK